MTATGHAMNAPTDKDYIDAKLQAVIEKMNGDIRAHQLTTDARLDKLDETVAHGLQTLDLRITQVESKLDETVAHGLQSLDLRITQVESNFQHELQLLREEFNAKLAQMETNFHRSQIDVMKSTIGSMVALTAVSVTVTSVLFLNLSRKEEAPLKPHTSAVSSPLSGPTAHGGQRWCASWMTAEQSARLVATRPALVV